MFSNSACCLHLPIWNVPHQAISISPLELTGTATHCPSCWCGSEHPIFHTAPEHKSHEVTPLLKPSNGTHVLKIKSKLPGTIYKPFRISSADGASPPSRCNHHRSPGADSLHLDYSPVPLGWLATTCFPGLQPRPLIPTGREFGGPPLCSHPPPNLSSIHHIAVQCLLAISQQVVSSLTACSSLHPSG